MKPILASLFLLLPISTASADILITFTDGGPGSTDVTITGTFNATGGNSQGRGSIQDFSFVAPTNFQFRRTTTAASTTEGVDLLPNPANPATWYSQSTVIRPSGLTIDGFSVSGIAGNGLLQIVSLDGTHVGETTLNESFILPTDFSNFTPGTWEWGGAFGQQSSGTAPLNAATLQIGTTAVPEPSTGGAMLFVLLAGTVFHRKRRR